MKFQPGDKVTFLNESGSGEVVAVIDSKKCLVRTQEGFELVYENRFLVPLADLSDYNELSPKEELGLIRNKLKSERSLEQKQKKEKARQEARQLEVDLHIYELVDNTRGLSNHDMLQIQMKHFRAKMAEANSRKIYKLIIIHGVGEGVLRSEIRHALRQYENIEFGDADYTQFGYGATQVIFKRWD